MYCFLKNEINKGRQAYIVCPAVEDSENGDDLRSAKAVYEALKTTVLKNLRIALTWGNQKSEEKNRILNGFIGGEYDILVATTVIEVGINNPNATIMIIENAERFGISQLHQLRGRVGRGSEESWCFLLAEPSEKLDVLCRTNDGFVISKKDLELRGPGDLIGTRQSGDTGILSMITGGSRLLEEVSEAVRELHRNPDLSDTLHCLEQYSRSYFEQSGQAVELS